jgi:UDP-3-O-[3-hydroxymyristoyl] glucosamine N-acyltransferase
MQTASIKNEWSEIHGGLLVDAPCMIDAKCMIDAECVISARVA